MVIHISNVSGVRPLNPPRNAVSVGQVYRNVAEIIGAHAAPRRFSLAESCVIFINALPRVLLQMFNKSLPKSFANNFLEKLRARGRVAAEHSPSQRVRSNFFH